MDRLRCAKESDEWDMGDICLAQCNDPLAAISAVQDTALGNDNTAESSIRSWDPQEFGPLSFIPGIPASVPWGSDNLQYPWASLWDMLEYPGATF